MLLISWISFDVLFSFDISASVLAATAISNELEQAGNDLEEQLNEQVCVICWCNSEK